MDYHLIIFIILYIFFVFFLISIRNVFEIGKRYVLFACNFVYFLVITLFLLDYYNFFSFFYPIMSGDRWFVFISTLISAAFGSIISGIILISVTRKQIEEQNLNYKDDKRIQNAPILKYDISNNKIETSNELFLFNGDGEIYCIYFSIENIGLNHARNIIFFVDGDDIKSSRKYKIDNSQAILRRDDSISFSLVINYNTKKKNNIKNIDILVTYEDLLKNKYSQKIKIIGEPTRIFGSQYGGYMFNINKCEVENEKYIEE